MNKFTFGGTTAPNAFGSSTLSSNAFGTPQSSGANNAFGATQSQPFGSGFGGTSTGTNTTASSVGSGLFGNSTNTATSNPSNGMFGTNNTAINNKPPQTGLFGNVNQNSNATGNSNTTGSGLFGSSTNGQINNGSTGLFNNSSNSAGNSAPSSNLFGSNVSGGLFGNSSTSANNATTTNAGASSGGLFGSANNNSGNVFGNNNSNTGVKPGGLFGSNTGANTSTGNGMFGNSNTNTNSTNTGGLFGNSNTNTSTNTNSVSGGLFGNTGGNTTSTTSGGLFGNSGNNTTGTTGGLFGGGNTNSSGLFGKSQNSQPSMFNQKPQPLIATINEASYVLPDSTPSQKLYTSLTVPSKRMIQHENRIDGGRVIHNSVQVPEKTSTPLNFPKVSIIRQNNPQMNVFDSSNVFNSTNNQTEPRQLMNSYDDFLKDRPTTLMIKNEMTFVPFSDHGYNNDVQGSNSTARLSSNYNPDISISSSIPQIAIGSNIVRPGLSTHTSSSRLVKDTKTAEAGVFTPKSHNMTVIKVNKEAVDAGYYTSPKLEELAQWTPKKLETVENLVIGQRGVGKLEFPEPVNLRKLAERGKLGDLLGELVIFQDTTVCVYPVEEEKAPEGTELNIPCIITLENSWPRTVTGKLLKNMSEAKLGKYIQKLKATLESDGAEFITFINGILVFKVPHFSTWGVPVDDLLMDEDDEDDIDVSEGNITEEHFVNIITRGEASPEMTEEIMDIVEKDQEKGNKVVSQDISEGLNNSKNVNIETTRIEKSTTWLDSLRDTPNSLALPTASLAAASVPTADLDLQSILVPKKSLSELKESGLMSTDSVDSCHNINTICFSVLRSKLVSNHRDDSILPILSTEFKNNEMPPEHFYLWELLNILFGNFSRGKLEKWCDIRLQNLSSGNKVFGSAIASQENVFDLILNLLASHKVKEASALAKQSNNLHLATIIAMLDNKMGIKIANENAGSQLEAWKVSGQLCNIPLGVQRVYEIAAGHGLPRDGGWSWIQLLGTKLWYSDEDYEHIIKSLANCVAEYKNPIRNRSGNNTHDEHEEGLAGLFFLMARFDNCKSLKLALSKLDLVSSFYAIQMLNRYVAIDENLNNENNNCNYDSICERLIRVFLDKADNVSALCLALHVKSSDKATTLFTEIIRSFPVDTDLPRELGVAEQFLNETRALRVEESGQYKAQAQYLILAENFEAAHTVMISRLGPQAYLLGNLKELQSMLLVLEEHKDQISHWNTGALLYLTMLQVQCNNDQLLPHQIPIFLNALSFASTPTFLSVEAVSKISNWFASRKTVWALYNAPQLMNLKYRPSDAKLQAMQQSYRLML
ncbi:nucleocytoplasmic transporter [Starmerella bacillaris]|uniref:Nucleocytoplasmic transporter n=1 Tax=Starmerella bacillaris TaxID=1247836 RepID=A0AAV5RM28_STABA|nr:nucleocytoplasmic transporter [Starmerella bacillaris]